MRKIPCRSFDWEGLYVEDGRGVDLCRFDTIPDVEEWPAKDTYRRDRRSLRLSEKHSKSHVSFSRSNEKMYLNCNEDEHWLNDTTEIIPNCLEIRPQRLFLLPTVARSHGQRISNTRPRHWPAFGYRRRVVWVFVLSGLKTTQHPRLVLGPLRSSAAVEVQRAHTLFVNLRKKKSFLRTRTSTHNSGAVVVQYHAVLLIYFVINSKNNTPTTTATTTTTIPNVAHFPFKLQVQGRSRK